MKKIFFVIPVYKVENYLKRCVDSVLSQTYPAVEIILVDDGSPDKCPEICDEFAKEYDNIKVIHKQNGGLSDARNAGIEYVREVADSEDYLTFLDSDDYVHPKYSEMMVNLCGKYNCNMAQCGYEKGAEDCFGDNKISDNIEVTDSNKALLGYRIKSQICAKVCKVGVFDNILFPIGVINEDEFTTYRAVYNAERIVFSDAKLYYYFQHGSGIMAEVAKKMKDNPRRFDFLTAYEERINFFEDKNMFDQVLKTREKICTDIILRYCEQMYLPKYDRDTDCVNGTYMKIYRDNFKSMIKRANMPIKRRMMYIVFYYMPAIGVLLGKFITMRK